MSTVYGIKGNDTLYAKIVDDDYQLLDNETFNQPEDNICKPFSFNKETNTISGISQEQFDKIHADSEKSDVEMMSDIMQNVAIFQLTQAKTNSKLLQQIALLTNTKETNNG